MLPRTSPVSKSWLPLSKAAWPLPVILRSCTDTTYWCGVACGSACPRQTLAEDKVAKEIRRVVGKKRRNLLPNRNVFIATCSRAGKSSPVNAFILKTKTRHKRSILFLCGRRYLRERREGLTARRYRLRNPAL